MPRIPVRTEPYADVLRQHRHYKNKRDLILRSLGKASYINGSQFAIVFISAKGDVERFGSEMVQDDIKEVFDEEVIERLRKQVKETNDRRREALEVERRKNEEEEDEENKPLAPSEVLRSAKKKKREAMQEEERKRRVAEASASAQKGKGRKAAAALAGGDDEDDDEEEEDEENLDGGDSDFEVEDEDLRQVKDDPDATMVELDDAAMIAKIDAASAFLNNAPSKTIRPANIVASTPARKTHHSAASFLTPAPVTKLSNGASTSTLQFTTPAHAQSVAGSSALRGGISTLSFDTPNSTSAGTPISTSGGTIVIPAGAGLDAYYLARFNDLQQMTCKLVVKTWIKVIEPKKQSKYPYNKGEDAKPVWWPARIRHKEPDHLMKPERTELLLAIIRSPLVKVSKLEIATAEASAYISQSKMRILREVYRVAKEEEKRRDTPDANADIIIHAPSSPALDAMALSTPAKEVMSVVGTPATPNLLASASAAKAILQSSPSRGPGMALPVASVGRGRKRAHEQQQEEENKENQSVFNQSVREFKDDFSGSRKPRMEPKVKKARQENGDAMGGDGLGAQHAPFPALRPMYPDFAAPFSSSPLQHSSTNRWNEAPAQSNTSSAAHERQRLAGIDSWSLPMDTSSKGMGNVLRGGSVFHDKNIMNRSPAIAQEESRPGTSHSYSGYAADTPSRLPMMQQYATAYNPADYYPSPYEAASPYAAHAQAHQPSATSMASIQPTFYQPSPYGTGSPAPPPSAFQEAMGRAADPYGRTPSYSMTDYVQSSGYSVQNQGEFPFAAQN